MKIDLELTNFRNFNKKNLKITPPTIIVGENATGKTNIIESIFLISTTNSFKNSHSADFIRSNKNFAKIQANVPEHEFELRFIKQDSIKKEAYLDQRKVALSEIVGSLPTVVFAPESLHIIKSSPALRRSFLNITLSQTDSDYLNSLLGYNKVKEERNKLLSLINSGYSHKDELEFWDDQLVKNGSKLILKRREYINFLNKEINLIYNQLSKKAHQLVITYQTNSFHQNSEGPLASNEQEIRNKYAQVISESLKNDLRYTTTTRGPHRDDFEITIDGRRMAGVGSQGEVRSLAFAMKVLEKEYFKNNHFSNNFGLKPLFLLDDPLSELDNNRVKFLLNKMKKTQAVITALEGELRGNQKLTKDFQMIKI